MSILDQLNMSPQEKRVVVGGSVLLFLVLNLWFVWPHYGELGETRDRLQHAETTLTRYQLEVAQLPTRQEQLNQFEKQGALVLAEEQFNTVINEIVRLARKSKLNYEPPEADDRSENEDPDSMLQKRKVTLKFNPSSTEALIEFLIALPSSELAIRVLDLSIAPNRTRPHPGTMLAGSMTLVASFQKNAPAPASDSAASEASPSPLAARNP